MSLPEPDFIARDPEVIEAEIFARWEALGGAPLVPTDKEAMLLLVLAYRETLVRIGLQEAAKATLPRFARFPVLDFLGELVGVTRLPAQAAQTTLEFVLPAVHGADILIAAGTRRKSKDGKVVFETKADVTLKAGDLSVSVDAISQTTGEVGNGYIAGQVSVEVDALPNLIIAQNTTTTAGGAPQETDERFFKRFLLAPDAYSTAGPEEAYRFHALTASGAVADVDVDSPVPGQIVVTVLDIAGVPGATLLGIVAAALSPKDVRPMSDTVSVVPCVEVTWTLDVALTLYADADQAETLAAVTQQAQDYRTTRGKVMGRDLIDYQIDRALSHPGVYDLVINSPVNTPVAPNEWANCTAVTVSIAGTSSERMVDK